VGEGDLSAAATAAAAADTQRSNQFTSYVNSKTSIIIKIIVIININIGNYSHKLDIVDHMMGCE
jgi:hypothetical protein